MEYVLTLWLFWYSPFDAVLVEVAASSCEVALKSTLEHVKGDGVSEWEIISCHLTQDT